MMPSLPEGYRTLIIGSSGTIGSAFLELLQSDPRCSQAIGIHRQSSPAINYADEASIEMAAEALASSGPFHLIINAIGILHTDVWSPEKKGADLCFGQLEAIFRINAFGPAVTLAKFSACGRAAHALAVVHWGCWWLRYSFLSSGPLPLSSRRMG